MGRLAANRDDQHRADSREVAYAASHELRAPLVAISQLVDAIREDYAAELPEEVTRRLIQVRHRADRLEGLLKGLTKYLRAGDGAEPVTSLDLPRLVDEIGLQLDAPSGAVIKAEPASIEAPRRAMSALIGELIDNALRHSERDDVHIRVAATRHPAGWELSVSDNGPGIPAAYRERVWRPFVALEPRSSRSGLGLSIARRIAKANGGRVWIDTAPGGGARVSVFWPRAPGP